MSRDMFAWIDPFEALSRDDDALSRQTSDPFVHFARDRIRQRRFEADLAHQALRDFFADRRAP
jgi:hypothetical protein